MQNKKSKGSKWNYIIIAITALILVMLLSTMDDPEKVWQALRAADMRFMAAAMGLMVAFWYLESVLLRQTTRSFGHSIGRWASLRVSMIGQLFNNITPFASGGQPIQVYEMSRYGISYGPSSCIMLVKFVVYQLAMTLYSLFMTIWRFGYFSERITGFGLFITAGFVTNVFALTMITSVGFFPRATHKVIDWLMKLCEKLRLLRNREAVQQHINTELDHFYTNFQIMRKNPLIVIKPLIVTLLQLTAYFTIPHMLFMALGIEGITYLDSFSATLFVFMVTSFIPSPGASGGAEGSFYWFLSIFVEKGDLLLMTMVLWRVITYYIPIAVGYCFYLVGRPRKADAAQ